MNRYLRGFYYVHEISRVKTRNKTNQMQKIGVLWSFLLMNEIMKSYECFSIVKPINCMQEFESFVSFESAERTIKLVLEMLKRLQKKKNNFISNHLSISEAQWRSFQNKCK